jgi:hypothetical protein
MKKFLFLLIGMTSLTAVSSCKREDTENPPLYSNADQYIKDSDGNRYVVQSAQLIGTKAKNATELNKYTILLKSTDNGVVRNLELVQSFPFNEKLDGGFSTTSTIRNIDSSKSKYTRGTTEMKDFAFASCSIVDLDAHNFKVIFKIETQSGETISGTYSGQFQVDIN